MTVFFHYSLYGCANVYLVGNDQTKEAAVSVGQDQFSLAIGRGGQNVRLAAELTGWRITVVEDGNEEAVAVSSEDDEDAIKEKLEAEKEGDTVADVADVSEETEVQEEIASEEPPVEAEEPAEK